MEITDELIVIVLAFACGAASAWMCLENRINEINAENDFILQRKEHVKECWDGVKPLVCGLREVKSGDGAMMGGYFDRYELDACRERIRELEILLDDEWKLPYGRK